MKRRKNPAAYRKRVAKNLADHNASSTQLRQIGKQISRRNFAPALAAIDQQVAVTTDPSQQAKLLSLAADCQHKQGKFAEAAVTYAQVGQLVAADPLAWLRPVIGVVGSLVQDCQTQAAQDRALLAVQQAVAFEQAYQTTLAQAQATVAAGGQAVIPPAPVRASVVATRLGKIFFQAGEIAPAKALFQSALTLNPNGACKARIGLAEVALRENNPTEAARLAREAIVVGQYRKKTLPAWKTLLAAGRRSGTDLLDATLLNSLASQSKPSVRAKAVLLLVRQLRSQGDARWKTIADNWLALPAATNHPIFAAEVRKLKLADARLFNAPVADRQLAALNLLQTAKIGSGEWLCATRETVRTALQQNQDAGLDAKIAVGATKFGAASTGRITHGLAHACNQAGRSDLAQTLFQRNVDTLPVGEVWGKSQWSLAKLKSAQADHAGAATGFWNFSQQTALPQKLRVTALIQWMKELLASGQADALAQARPQIEAALPALTDYEQVLDLSRQVLAAKLGFPFAKQIFLRGQELAYAAFDAAGHPSPAVTILYKLARRANTDFRDAAATLATWTRLTDAKKQWLWTEKEDYWYYLELVFRSYRDTNRAPEAEAFMAPLLADSATPAHGYAILGTSYAILKKKLGDTAAMFATYEKIIQAAPTHEWSSSAYYWLALRAWKQGNATQTATFTDKLLQTVGKTSTLYWKQNYRVSALLLKAGLNLAQIPAQTEVPADKLQKQLQAIQTDLASFNS